MAHYAFLDENNIVTGVIVGKDEGTDGIDWEQKYGEIQGQTCKMTSYNTKEGHHHDGGTPFRGNYAGIGYTYNEDDDIFLPPKPYPSWKLYADSPYVWKAPIAEPNDGKGYTWNEETTSWDLIDE